MHHAPSMIDPALEAPCRLVSEKYRVRGCISAATYHKVSRFAPGRGPGWPTIGVHTPYLNILTKFTRMYTTVLQLYVPVLNLVRAGTAVLQLCTAVCVHMNSVSLLLLLYHCLYI